MQSNGCQREKRIGGIGRASQVGFLPFLAWWNFSGKKRKDWDSRYMKSGGLLEVTTFPLSWTYTSNCDHHYPHVNQDPSLLATQAVTNQSQLDSTRERMYWSYLLFRSQYESPIDELSSVDYPNGGQILETVTYGLFSSFASDWLGLLGPNSFERTISEYRISA